MKKLTLHAPLFAAALLIAVPMQAQSTTAPIPADGKAAPAEKQPIKIVPIGKQKYAHMSTITSVQGNREFMNSIRTGLQLKQLLTEYSRRHSFAITTPEKEALAVRISALQGELIKFNEEMKKIGYSTEAQFFLQVVKSRIYTQITDEEYNRLPESERTRAGNITTQTSKEDGKEVTLRYKYVTTLDSIEANDKFGKEVEKVQRLRASLEQISQHNAETNLDAESRKKVDVEIKKVESEITALNDDHIRQYKFSLAKVFQETEIAELYLLLNPEAERKIEEYNASLAKPATTGATTTKP